MPAKIPNCLQSQQESTTRTDNQSLSRLPSNNAVIIVQDGKAVVNAKVSKSDEQVLVEDKTIEKVKVGPTSVEIVPVAEVLEQ